MAFIGGEHRRGKCAVRVIVGPADGTAVSEVADCTSEQVAEAVRLARTAQPAWEDRVPAERSRVLLRLADLLEARAD
jgi:acyl-CoA reductase-like NAD-dependent aldehyde dehydrogenase